mgnify:CR=1 FL=1
MHHIDYLRLLIDLDRQLAGDGLNVRDRASHHGVSVKTIRRAMDDLRELTGSELTREGERGGSRRYETPRTRLFADTALRQGRPPKVTGPQCRDAIAEAGSVAGAAARLGVSVKTVYLRRGED